MTAALLFEASGTDGPLLTFVVPGDPVGQGNLRRNEHGASYHANGKRLKPWRAAVRDAAVLATGRHAYAAPPKLTRTQRRAGMKRPAPICTVCGIRAARHGQLLGPARFEAVLTFARPASAPNRAYPITRNVGDWDHHGRSVSDALTGVVVADDAQIVDGRVIKTYPGSRTDALAEPGALIRIWEVL